MINQKQVITFRNKQDIEGLQRDLEEVCDNIAIEEDNFEQSYSSYHKTSQDITDKYVLCITKTVKVTSNIPWMDEEFRNSRKKRCQLEKKWRKNKYEENRQNYVEQPELCAKMLIVK